MSQPSDTQVIPHQPASGPAPRSPLSTPGEWLQYIARHGWPGVDDEYHDARRASRRVTVQAPARVSFRLDAGSTTYDVELTNISAGGLEFRHWREIPRGAVVLLAIDDGVRPVLVVGTVAHCSPAQAEMRIGVKLHFHW